MIDLSHRIVQLVLGGDARGAGDAAGREALEPGRAVRKGGGAADANSNDRELHHHFRR